MNTRNILKGLETTISCLPFKLGYRSEAKARGLLHSPEPPQIGGACGGGMGGGPPQDARKTRALGLSVRSGPGVRQGPPRRCGRPPSPWTATTQGPLGLAPCSQLQSRLPGPKPPDPGSTARHSARAHAWPSPGRCGRSR